MGEYMIYLQDSMIWCRQKMGEYMIDLQEYGVAKKWVSITEISEEVVGEQ
jgi:hypothetical protein